MAAAISLRAVDDTEMLVKWLAETWASRTLSDLESEARESHSGVTYSALRAGPGNGRRVVLVACVTDLNCIERLERTFAFDPEGTSADFESARVFDVVLRTTMRSGFAFEDRRDADGKRVAILLVATSPDSMQIVETVLGLI